MAATLNAWNRNVEFRRISRALNEKELVLANAFGQDSGLLRAMRSERQVWEWHEIGLIANARSLKNINIHDQATPLMHSWLQHIIGYRNAARPGEWLFRLALLAPGVLDPKIASHMKSAFAQIGVNVPELKPEDRQAMSAAVSLAEVSGGEMAGFMDYKLLEFRSMQMNTHDAIASTLYSVLPEAVWTTGDSSLLPLFGPIPSRTGRSILDARHVPARKAAAPYIYMVEGLFGGFDVYVSQMQKWRHFDPPHLSGLKVLLRSSGAKVLYGDSNSARLLAKLGVNGTNVRNYLNKRQAEMFASSRRKLADGAEELTLRYAFRSEKKPGLDVTFLKLSNRGDSIVVRAPDGSIILVDTGLTKELIPKLRAEFGGTIPPIRLVITHTDADHIRGLESLIKDKSIKLEEVIVGRYRGDMTKTAKRILGELQTVARLEKLETKVAGVTHFVANDKLAPLFSIASENDGDVERWTLRALRQLQMYVYHLNAATAPNDGGLVVQLRYRGIRELLTDDISPRVLRALVNSDFGDDLESGIMKWPHHVWFPSEKREGDRQVLKEFLRAVNPHTIIFSNIGAANHFSNWPKVQRFIDEVLGKSVRRVWTLDRRGPANIRILTENRSTRELRRAA